MKQTNLKENPTNLPPIFIPVLIWIKEEKPQGAMDHCVKSKSINRI